MLNVKMHKRLLVALAACAATCVFGGNVYADDTKGDAAALKEQLRIMQQRIEELSRQVDSLTKQAAQPPAVMTAPPPPPVVAKQAPPAEPKFEKFLKGFYGTLDVSFDDVTKGINGLTAYSYSLVNPANPNSGFVQGPPKGAQQVGRLGYLPAMSTNKSQIGYRNTHKIGDSDYDFIMQVETSLAITAAPGLRTSYTQQSNNVTGAIGLGDTFIGLQKNDWGKLKFGTTYAPYKKSTDRMNPFSGMLGDYAVVMGNTGGDNRVEFGTRLEHALWYESPNMHGVTLNVLVSPGQNRAFDNTNIPSGETGCAGGNLPGSGALPPACNDGS